MEYIIAFNNTNQAIKAEHCLLEKKLRVDVIPLPPKIRAGCGICLRIAPEDIAIATSTLTENGIEGTAVFSRVKNAGSYDYAEIL